MPQKISIRKIIFTLAAAMMLGVFFAADKVLAATAPILALNGEANMILAYGSSYNDPGAQCQDALGNQLSVTVSGNVDVFTAGKYTINYDCQESENKVGLSRTVSVNIKPASPIGSCFKKACVKVVFGEWGDCANGWRSRSMISLDNADCCFTQEQVAGEQEACAVLGVKLYPAGSLLRVPSHKIYFVVSTSTVKYVSGLKELWQYRGREIFNVSEEILIQYKQILGVKIYADGTLLRGPDYRIYLIANGRKQYISSFPELAKYKNHKTYNVSADVLAQY
jgi:hypothetical protein